MFVLFRLFSGVLVGWRRSSLSGIQEIGKFPNLSELDISEEQDMKIIEEYTSTFAVNQIRYHGEQHPGWNPPKIQIVRQHVGMKLSSMNLEQPITERVAG